MRYIITGMSGTGKTVLLERFRREDYCCFDEPARKILAAHLPEEGEGFARSFIDLMLRQSLSDYKAATGPVAFYDRGLPDVVAYAVRFGVDAGESRAAAKAHQYEPTVFVAPPWPEIFEHDEYRRASFEDYLEFHDLLLDTYRQLGYACIELPRESVSRRMEFVMAHLGGDV